MWCVWGLRGTPFLKLRFAFHLFRPGLDPLELVIPEPLIRLDPVVHGPEPLAVQAVHLLPAFPNDADEPDLAKHPEVLGNLRLRPAQLLDQPRHITLAPTITLLGEGPEDL